MSSDLARQLRQVQQQDQVLGGFSQGSKYRASFLFDPSEAVQYDAASIYALGLAGLAELQQMEPVFLKFQPMLFSSQSIDLDRALLTAGENEQLDAQITSFLRYLSPYFLQRPAHKVLEWLVRKYRVNEMNVEALVECILPYHEAVPFVRMVQILYFREDDRWGFLFDVKQHAKAINRTYLAQRCLADRTILGSVFKAAQWHAENGGEMRRRNPHIIPFFTYLCIEYMHLRKKLELTDVTFLLPFVLGSLTAKRCPDIQMTGYMLFIQLLAKTSLSSETIGEVALTAAKCCAETVASECVLFLAQVARVNPASTLPDRVFTALAELPTIQAAVDKAAGSFEIDLFLEAFLQAMRTLSSAQTEAGDTNASLVATLESRVGSRVESAKA